MRTPYGVRSITYWLTFNFPSPGWYCERDRLAQLCLIISSAYLANLCRLSGLSSGYLTKAPAPGTVISQAWRQSVFSGGFGFSSPPSLKSHVADSILCPLLTAALFVVVPLPQRRVVCYYLVICHAFQGDEPAGHLSVSFGAILFSSPL